MGSFVATSAFAMLALSFLCQQKTTAAKKNVVEINQKREEQDLSQSTAKVDSAGGRRIHVGGSSFLQPTTDLKPPVAALDDVLNHTLLVLFGRQLSGRNDVYGKRRIAVGRNSKRATH